ncbi:MAG: hypothetical protein GF401_02855 [Chitinivibrionales bacterium]|nr:hypothetical protein [Chitinivibrionales bacterium]
MSIFDDRYRNDETGAPAYDPRILLKIILFAYFKGVIYSRRIAQLCSENEDMPVLRTSRGFFSCFFLQTYRLYEPENTGKISLFAHNSF